MKKTLMGSYQGGLTIPEFNQLVGEIITSWPHAEESMIGIFSELLGVYQHQVPMRQVFRSITSQHTRITIMRNLLQENSRNANKSVEYDKIIDEFSSLNRTRNDYAHGLWHTHESNRVFLASPEGEHSFPFEPREVTIQELQTVLNRIKEFKMRALRFAWNEMKERAIHEEKVQKRKAQWVGNSASTPRNENKEH